MPAADAPIPAFLFSVSISEATLEVIVYSQLDNKSYLWALRGVQGVPQLRDTGCIRCVLLGRSLLQPGRLKDPVVPRQ